VCVCVRVCVRERVCVCVCARARISAMKEYCIGQIFRMCNLSPAVLLALLLDVLLVY